MSKHTLTYGAVLTSRPLRSKIASAAQCDERAVYRAYAGEPTRPATHAAITVAARKMKLPEPPAIVEVHRRTHSGESNVRCEICAPCSCEKAR